MFYFKLRKKIEMFKINHKLYKLKTCILSLDCFGALIKIPVNHPFKQI